MNMMRKQQKCSWFLSTLPTPGICIDDGSKIETILPVIVPMVKERLVAVQDIEVVAEAHIGSGARRATSDQLEP